MIIKSIFRNFLRKFGKDLVGFDPRFNPQARKLHLLQRFHNSVLLDVGANIGQFATWAQGNGWKGEIHSFEPGAKAFKHLLMASEHSNTWHAHCLALGEGISEISMNISSDSFSSSLLSPTQANIAAHKGVRSEFEETVKMSTMDHFAKTHGLSNTPLVVKIDTQGYESQVLAGGSLALQHTSLLIVELSLKELYSGQRLFHEVLPQLMAMGFYPTILEPCDEDYRRLELLQVDVWFLKTNAYA